MVNFLGVLLLWKTKLLMFFGENSFSLFIPEILLYIRETQLFIKLMTTKKDIFLLVLYFNALNRLIIKLNSPGFVYV